MNRQYLTAVVANAKGEIFDLEGFAAVGMSGQQLLPLFHDQSVSMPYGSELMLLPDRTPILFNIDTHRLEIWSNNPYAPEEMIYPVAVFNSPGYIITHNCAYEQKTNAPILPLFSYGAIGWHKGGFRSAAMLVDRERRQDLRLMPRQKVISGTKRLKKKMPSNRLRMHLENCALKYGCPAAKNFFIGRCEAPLPTSTFCNANCLGCLSLQDHQNLSSCQERIKFTPTADEIAQIALEHIGNVKQSVVSFGQGCEGDPVFAHKVIEPAIRKIRSSTSAGTINMNTNASLPKVVENLIKAGLDSIRVSLNSVRSEFYHGYFRPNGYSFSDVLKSIDMTIGYGKFVSVNYLNCPGFTDCQEEFEFFLDFLKRFPVNLIQWRNLNYDPKAYWQKMNEIISLSPPIGTYRILTDIRQKYPLVKHGYFNPPKEKFKPDPIKT